MWLSTAFDLSHNDNRRFTSTSQVVQKTMKDTKGDKDEPLLWTDVHFTVEAKRSTNAKNFNEALQDALVRALRIKDTWVFTGNVYCMVLANNEASLLCVNAGKVLQMPVINVEANPERFIRMLILTSSHGACHQYWSFHNVDLICPAFLNPSPCDRIALLPLTPVESWAGQLVWQSDITDADWLYRTAQQGFPFRLCGSRTVVVSGHGLLDGKRWNFVMKFPFLDRSEAANEATILSKLQASALSAKIKTRLPHLLKCGISNLDQLDGSILALLPDREASLVGRCLGCIGPTNVGYRKRTFLLCTMPMP